MVFFENRSRSFWLSCPFRFSSFRFFPVRCFQHVFRRAHTQHHPAIWLRLQHTHTHIRWWSDRRVKTTNDKRINSRLICYLFRNCRFECNKIYAVSARARVHWMGIAQSEKKKKNKRQQREWRRRRWANIYLFVLLLRSESRSAEERRLTFDKYLWSRIWPYSA